MTVNCSPDVSGFPYFSGTSERTFAAVGFWFFFHSSTASSIESDRLAVGEAEPSIFVTVTRWSPGTAPSPARFVVSTKFPSASVMAIAGWD